MSAKGSAGDTVGSQRQLRVGRKNNELRVLAQFVVWMKAHERVKDGKTAILQPKQLPCFGSIPKDFPFVRSLARLDLTRLDLPLHQGKRHRPPPKGRRHTSIMHFLHLQKGKRNLLTKVGCQRLLTGIRGNAIL
jgi:hypothetical protein